MSDKNEDIDSSIIVAYPFHLLDFIVGTMFCIDAYFIISTANTIPRAVLPVYYFVFGLIIIMLIFYAHSIIRDEIGFYWTLIGRSFTFLFLSAPLISFGSTLDILAGITTLCVGFVYLIFAILTCNPCPVLILYLPPPIFQRNEVDYDAINKGKQPRRQPQKQTKWKYKEREKKLNKGRKKNTPKPTYKTSDAVIADSGGDIADRMKKYDVAITDDTEMTEKLTQLKQDHSKDIKTMDKRKKKEATEALSQYADAKVAHIKDINALNTELKDITKSNAVGKMMNLGLMRHIFVKKDRFERYSARNQYSNMILNEEYNDDKEDDVEYTKMYVLNMMNSALLTKLTDDQQIQFEKLLLCTLSSVDQLYIVELTRSNLNDVLLSKIIKVLRDRRTLFGPEEFKCESNKITDHGMQYIIDYISANDCDLKVIKAGHLFSTISSEMCKLCGSVLSEKNEYLLQLSIDIQWPQYQTTIDNALIRNNDIFREERKQQNKKHNDDVVIVFDQDDVIVVETNNEMEDVLIVEENNDVIDIIQENKECDESTTEVIISVDNDETNEENNVNEDVVIVEQDVITVKEDVIIVFENNDKKENKECDEATTEVIVSVDNDETNVQNINNPFFDKQNNDVKEDVIIIEENNDVKEDVIIVEEKEDINHNDEATTEVIGVDNNETNVEDKNNPFYDDLNVVDQSKQQNLTSNDDDFV